MPTCIFFLLSFIFSSFLAYSASPASASLIPSWSCFSPSSSWGFELSSLALASIKVFSPVWILATPSLAWDNFSFIELISPIFPIPGRILSSSAKFLSISSLVFLRVWSLRFSFAKSAFIWFFWFFKDSYLLESSCFFWTSFSSAISLFNDSISASILFFWFW